MSARDDQSDTRRTLLRTALGAAAATVLSACEFRRRYPDAGTPLDAGEPDASADGGPHDALDEASIARTEDVDGLDALLATEYTLAAAYAALAPALQSPDAADPLAGAAPVLLAIAVRWRQQHLDAASALVDAIAIAGGVPVAQNEITFTPPAGVTLTITNVLKLACNAEKSAAVSHARRTGQLAHAFHRQLAGSVAGAHTQRFMALFALLSGAAQPAAAIASMVDQVVPTAFVLGIGNRPGLETVGDLAFT